MIAKRFLDYLVPVLLLAFLSIPLGCSTTKPTKEIFTNDEHLIFDGADTLGFLETAFESKLPKRFLRRASSDLNTKSGKSIQSSLEKVFERHENISLSIHSLRVVNTSPQQKTYQLRWIWRLDWECVPDFPQCEGGPQQVRRKGETIFHFRRQNTETILISQDPPIFGHFRPGSRISSQ